VLAVLEDQPDATMARDRRREWVPRVTHVAHRSRDLRDRIGLAHERQN
jgi:hypothetical protein